MYFLYTKKYKCIFIIFSRCWSKTMINWIADIEEIERPKNHDECIQNTNICMNNLLNSNIYVNKFYKIMENTEENIEENMVENIVYVKNKIKELFVDYSIYFMVRNPG